MVEKSAKKIKNRKKVLLGLVIVAIVVIGVASFLLREAKVELPAIGPPVTPKEGIPPEGVPPEVPTEGVVACPKDYCGAIVCGAGPCPTWTGKVGVPCFEKKCCLEDGTQKYFEQTCYDYPDRSANCEAEKKTYYLVCGERQA
ncbi:MAG: hypothetical protein QMD14_04095 [Candidatus Aenigmarchaeota archaeon]|nr:hypothetical protein [Candidatus Aenigmarchaeota archaeon]